MKFLVDNQLPPARARFIQADLGYDAVHVIDVGLRDAGDAEVWTICVRARIRSCFQRRRLHAYGTSQLGGEFDLGACRQLPHLYRGPLRIQPPNSSVQVSNVARGGTVRFDFRVER